MELPEMPTGSWNEDDLTLFWHYLRWFLNENNMWIMIVIAFLLTIGVSGMIVNLFIPRSKRDDDEEEDAFDYL